MEVTYIGKCVYRQVIVHLESNSLLDCYQSAYKANHGCETALVKIHNIITLLDSKSNVVLIVFDLSAAFDTVHYKLLLCTSAAPTLHQCTVFKV